MRCFSPLTIFSLKSKCWRKLKIKIISGRPLVSRTIYFTSLQRVHHIRVLCLENSHSSIIFICSLTRWTFAENFLHSRHNSKCWGQSKEQNTPLTYLGNNNVISHNLECISFIKIFIFIILSSFCILDPLGQDSCWTPGSAQSVDTQRPTGIHKK